MTATKIASALILASLAGAALSGPAAAQSATEIRKQALEKRQEAQREEIRDGRKNGSITWLEKQRLNSEQRRIDKLESRVLKDGKITKQEYYDVKAAQTNASKHIASDESNDRVRGWWWRTFSR